MFQENNKSEWLLRKHIDLMDEKTTRVITPIIESKTWPSFSELIDNDLSKYYIQQPLYAQLFLDMLKNTPYKNIPFIGFRILHLRDGGKSFKIPRWVYKEIQKLFILSKFSFF